VETEQGPNKADEVLCRSVPLVMLAARSQWSGPYGRNVQEEITLRFHIDAQAQLGFYHSPSVGTPVRNTTDPNVSSLLHPCSNNPSNQEKGE